MGLFRRLIVNLSENPGFMSGLVLLYGSEHDRRIPGRDFTVLGRLAPHMGKALELHRVTHELRRRYNAVLSVLDHIDVGICLFDENDRLILKNRRAEDCFQEREGIWLDRSDRLVCRDPDDAARLADAIHRVGLTAAGKNSDRTEEIAIHTRAGRKPIYAIVSPLRDADMELERSLKGVLLTLLDARHEIQPSVDPVARAYALSPAETRVVGYILQGLSNSQISERLGNSPETVKSQVRSIFDKTGCRSRLALVWRVFQLTPPIL